MQSAGPRDPRPPRIEPTRPWPDPGRERPHPIRGPPTVEPPNIDPSSPWPEPKAPDPIPPNPIPTREFASQQAHG